MILFEAYRKKRTLQLAFFCLLVIGLIEGALIKPLYLYIASNRAFDDTVFPLLIDFTYTFLELIYHWVSFAFLLYAFTRFSTKVAWAVVGISVGATVLRYVIELLAGYFLMSFPLPEDLLMDLVGVAFDIFFMMIIIGIAFLLILFISRKLVAGAETERSQTFAPYFSFSRAFDLKNPILKAMLLLACIPGVMRILSHISTDLYLGAPSTIADLIWIIVTYLSDLLFVLIGHYVMMLIFNQIRMKELKSQMLYEAEQAEKEHKD